MLYPIFRLLARTAVRWYYRDVEVCAAQRMPRAGATLVAVNHSNALVDALVAVSVVPRSLHITAKATLFDYPILGPLLRALGMVPLRRVADEQQQQGRDDAGRPPVERNTAAFETLIAALGRGDAVLIFPEGMSHVGPQLAPLRSGLARIALAASDRGITPVGISPLGLTFERPHEPRSRVLAQFGEPIVLATGAAGSLRPETLTAQLDQRLRGVTLNFSSPEARGRARQVAAALALANAGRGADVAAAEPPLSVEAAIAMRVQTAAGLLDSQNADLRARAASLLDRLDKWQSTAATSGIALEDLWIDVRLAPAVRFILRESFIGLVALPFALWGAVNHWVPLRLARWIGLHTTRHPDEPAMRTIVAAFGLVSVFYIVQTAVVAALLGLRWAIAYLLTLPLTALGDFRFRDRCRRVYDRARTYLALRRYPDLRRSLQAEAAELWREAEELERLSAGSNNNPA